MVAISIKELNSALLPGLKALAEGGLLSLADDGLPIVAVKRDRGLTVQKDEGKITIGYSRVIEFFRGLSYVLQGACDINEDAVFNDNGYMLDCSRNAVASVPALKKLLRHMALMGLSTLQLYIEDTYEIPEWKYFGYQRGRYTAAEIRELDSYALALGIELIPCVQTLAHLNAALRWPEFRDIIDCNDILLAGEEKTYRLIDDMMRQLSSCYTTRRVHIGMDEAHMLGLGKYLDKHGYQNRSKIMCDHLAKVIDICKKYGLEPMMWSDMFFRLAFNDAYYTVDSLPEELKEMLPKGVDLVYWDYYHKDKAHYTKMVELHNLLPTETIFAGGAWRWSGLVPELQFSMDTTIPALLACKETSVKEVFATGWADDGAECSMFTTLPILQLYAEMGYGNDTSNLAARFKACTGGNWQDFFLLDNPNNTTKTRGNFVNTTKTLLYQDVMFGLFDAHVDPSTFPAHFRQCAVELTEAAARNGEWAYIFRHTANICRVLEHKCTMGLEITDAYLTGNKEKLRDIAEIKLPALQKQTEELLYGFEDQWNTENKPHGLEVIQIRIGAIQTRLDAAARRIKAYLDGKVEKLDELESERLGFTGDIVGDINAHCNRWKDIVTASRLSW